MEIDLMEKYPKRNRDTKARSEKKTQNIIDCNLTFGWEYFDKKGYCYEGYSYDGRWIPIVEDMIAYYDLKPGSKILDVGCAKGYAVYDFVNEDMDAYGIDISEYAVNASPPEIRDRLYVGNAIDLSRFEDNEFDLVISINCVHCLDEDKARQAIREIERVGKNKFLTVDSFRTKEEEERMMEWIVAGRTAMSTDDWIKLFEEEGYTGDYYWFII